MAIFEIVRRASYPDAKIENHFQLPTIIEILEDEEDEQLLQPVARSGDDIDSQLVVAASQ